MQFAIILHTLLHENSQKLAVKHLLNPSVHRLSKNILLANVAHSNQPVVAIFLILQDGGRMPSWI